MFKELFEANKVQWVDTGKGYSTALNNLFKKNIKNQRQLKLTYTVGNPFSINSPSNTLDLKADILPYKTYAIYSLREDINKYTESSLLTIEKDLKKQLKVDEPKGRVTSKFVLNLEISEKYEDSAYALQIKGNVFENAKECINFIKQQFEVAKNDGIVNPIASYSCIISMSQ